MLASQPLLCRRATPTCPSTPTLPTTAAPSSLASPAPLARRSSPRTRRCCGRTGGTFCRPSRNSRPSGRSCARASPACPPSSRGSPPTSLTRVQSASTRRFTALTRLTRCDPRSTRRRADSGWSRSRLPTSSTPSGRAGRRLRSARPGCCRSPWQARRPRRSSLRRARTWTRPRRTCSCSARWTRCAGCSTCAVRTCRTAPCCRPLHSSTRHSRPAPRSSSSARSWTMR
mmetsp:Transcript_17374/g.55565  ORF Transcript_17374/g.55565 Transcript_17374/m.55565 type:complete len:229 (+) Transcript_17374:196-882(+)